MQFEIIIINGKTVNPYKNGLSDFEVLKEVRTMAGILYLLRYQQWRNNKIKQLIEFFDGAKDIFEENDAAHKYFEFRHILMNDLAHIYSAEGFNVIRQWTLNVINENWRVFNK